MKTGKLVLMTAALFSAVSLSGAAIADRGGHSGGHGGYRGGSYQHGYGHAGAFIGGAIVAGALLSPWYYPAYYPRYYPTYYYQPYPAVVEVTPQPNVYIEQPRVTPAAADAGNAWYFCNDSRAYYPYVRECASPWQRVAPQPAPR
ncbi:MAG: hypothetical protein ABI831_20305 [Betaproteobacteria bacterium]